MKPQLEAMKRDAEAALVEMDAVINRINQIGEGLRKDRLKIREADLIKVEDKEAQ